MSQGQEDQQAWVADVPDPVRTGSDALDAVLDDVAALQDRPLDEHAHVFEAAQERLRHALDVASAAY